jgi:hypothetical protein
MKKSSENGGFSSKTKRDLADRAGHHCSLCHALTTCSDAEGRPFPIGDAAHQAAASAGGQRHDPNQTDMERSSADNGLWLCSSCHRKIDGDKYRYKVEDLKQMKEEAEELARRMVHGEVVFEVKDKEQAAIENYLSSRPLEKQLPQPASGSMFAVQIVPYSAITNRPRLEYEKLIMAGVPTSRNVFQQPTSDDKGVFAQIRQEVSRIDRDATAQMWINFPGLEGVPASERSVSGSLVAEYFLRYVRNARTVFLQHNIRSPRVIARARLENVLGKQLIHGRGPDGVFALKKPIIETSYVILDQGEDDKILRELWYCVGSDGLPRDIVEVVDRVSAELSR